MEIPFGEAQSLVDRLADDLLVNSALTDRTKVHLEVRDLPEIDMATTPWRPPGWDTRLAEARPGEEWDVDPHARIFVTMGLVRALTEAQLRALLAHEMAHIEAGDHLRMWVSGDEMRAMEQRADRRGTEISGDGPSLACGLLRLFRDVAPETAEHAATHGAVSERVDGIGSVMAEGFGL